MILEPVESINKRLKDYFGLFENGEPNWRVVWSEDMTEKRLCSHTSEGFELLTPEVRETKKYSYIQNRFVLERLVPVPQIPGQELITKLSYEPLWTFEDHNGNPTAPDFEMIKAFIQLVLENIHRTDQGPRYKMPEEMYNTTEAMEARAEKLAQMLFGNDTKISDSLGLDSAVGYGTRQRKDWLQ